MTLIELFNSRFAFNCVGYEFSKDGKYMLLAERRDCKDYCSVFECENWQLLKVLNHIYIKMAILILINYLMK